MTNLEPTPAERIDQGAASLNNSAEHAGLANKLVAIREKNAQDATDAQAKRVEALEQLSNAGGPAVTQEDAVQAKIAENEAQGDSQAA